ncbi:hypothetical protein ABZZ20_11440 [Streptomyces sp. NPDC006430]
MNSTTSGGKAPTPPAAATAPGARLRAAQEAGQLAQDADLRLVVEMRSGR